MSCFRRQDFRAPGTFRWQVVSMQIHQKRRKRTGHALGYSELHVLNEIDCTRLVTTPASLVLCLVAFKS